MSSSVISSRSSSPYSFKKYFVFPDLLLEFLQSNGVTPSDVVDDLNTILDQLGAGIDNVARLNIIIFILLFIYLVVRYINYNVYRNFGSFDMMIFPMITIFVYLSKKQCNYILMRSRKILEYRFVLLKLAYPQLLLRIIKFEFLSHEITVECVNPRTMNIDITTFVQDLISSTTPGVSFDPNHAPPEENEELPKYEKSSIDIPPSYDNTQ